LCPEEVRLAAYNELRSGKSIENHSKLIRILDENLESEMNRIIKLNGYIDKNLISNGGFENAFSNPSMFQSNSSFGNHGNVGLGSNYSSSAFSSSAFGSQRTERFGSSSSFKVSPSAPQSNFAVGSSVPQTSFGQSAPSFGSVGFGTSGFQQTISGSSSMAATPNHTHPTFGFESFGATAIPAFGSSVFGASQNPQQTSAFGTTGFGGVSGQQSTSSFGTMLGSGSEAFGSFGPSKTESVSTAFGNATNNNPFGNVSFGNQGGTTSMPAASSSFSSFGQNTGMSSKSNSFSLSSGVQANQNALTATYFDTSKTQINLTNPTKNLQMEFTGPSQSTDEIIDPISAFKAAKFFYGKIPESEPPEGLR
jgi:hypothetical protein